MRKLLIVQPYVPDYRVAFFDGLVKGLADFGVKCRVAAPPATGEQLLRGDSTGGHPWLLTTNKRQASTRWATFTSYGSRHLVASADAVVTPAAATCLDTHLAFARRPIGLRVGLWGHIGSYVRHGNRLDLAVEGWQLRHADQVFAYTPHGAQLARAAGVEHDKVVAVMNTIDTNALVSAANSVTDDDAAAFAAKHKLVANKTFAFIGGLDTSKRIDFLADVLDVLWGRDPQIKVLVAGDGKDRDLLHHAERRGQAVVLGHADLQLKAIMGRVSSALLMPGRVGLVAVDAMVLKLPVVTTEFDGHAPEIEYLQEGKSRFTSANSTSDYADLIHRLAGPRPAEIGDPPAAPTMDAMIGNFLFGAQRLLGAHR